MDGPAYVAPPRDTQRAAVDQTFLEQMDQAQQIKGSVFDTRKHKAMRDAYEMAEAGPQAGVVANPAAREFQRLKVLDPGLARAAQVMKPTTEWLQHQAGKFAPAVYGKTLGLRPDKMKQATEHLKTKVGAGPMDADEFKRLYEYNQRVPGSTMQAISPARGTDTTIIHEMLHALYGPKDARLLQAKLGKERGRELMTTALNRTGLPNEKKFAIASQYWEDPAHGLIEATAQFKADKAARGGMAVTR